MRRRAVSQPTAAPTNKLTATSLTYAILQILWLVLEIYFPEKWAMALYQLLALFIAFGVGYIIKDEDNTPEPAQPDVEVTVEKGGQVVVEK